MAKPSPDSGARPRLLVVELWGLGDLALALPFLHAAAGKHEVTLLAKPHAGPLLRRFAPAVQHIAFIAPWTAFTGKYRFLRWRWHELRRLRTALRMARFDIAASGRPDPRDHLLLAASGARRRLGFGRLGSRLFLTETLVRLESPHRAAYWSALARALGVPLLSPSPVSRPAKRIVIHTGAGHRVRQWPRARFEALADRLRRDQWDVLLVDDSLSDLDVLLATIGQAARFIGNDSGPGHLAALLGVPTFTIFGPQLPESFAPQHPEAAWIEGAACDYKPCFDACRFPSPHCMLDLSVDQVWARVESWLSN